MGFRKRAAHPNQFFWKYDPGPAAESALILTPSFHQFSVCIKSLKSYTKKGREVTPGNQTSKPPPPWSRTTQKRTVLTLVLILVLSTTAITSGLPFFDLIPRSGIPECSQFTSTASGGKSRALSLVISWMWPLGRRNRYNAEISKSAGKTCKEWKNCITLKDSHKFCDAFQLKRAIWFSKQDY